MNERIKELAEQAETKEIGYYFFDREKFAELIVDECVLKLLAMDENAKGNHNYFKHAALQVKQHFKEMYN